jgi:hypothetical protein
MLNDTEVTPPATDPGLAPVHTALIADDQS